MMKMMSSSLHCNIPGVKMIIDIRDQRSDGRPDTIALSIQSALGISTSYTTIFFDPAQLEILADEIGAYLDKLEQEKLEAVAAATDKAIQDMLSCV
jgi:hypothetical protein